MIRLKLTPDQRATLQALRRDRTLKPAERDRVEMALLSDAGWTVPQIAEHLGYCAQTVRRAVAHLGPGGPARAGQHTTRPGADVPRRGRGEVRVRPLPQAGRG